MLNKKIMGFTQEELQTEIEFNDTPQDIINAGKVGYRYEIDELLKAEHGIELYCYLHTERSLVYEDAKKIYNSMLSNAIKDSIKKAIERASNE